MNVHFDKTLVISTEMYSEAAQPQPAAAPGSLSLVYFILLLSDFKSIERVKNSRVLVAYTVCIILDYRLLWCKVVFWVGRAG